MTVHGYQHRPPFAEEAHIGRHLALGHGFLSPMDPSPDAPPSAWSAPLYPLAIAGAFRLFGVASPEAVTALMLLNAAFFGLIVAGTLRLSMLIFGTPVPGVLSAGAMAIHPFFLFFMGDFWDGYMGLALFVWISVSAVHLGRCARTGAPPPHGGAATFGIGLAMLGLTNASYVLAYPVLLLIAFSPAPRARQWRQAGTACALCVITLLPWTIRNYESLGRLVPIRIGSGIQFWIGNPPVSDGWLGEQAFAVHPSFNPDEQALLRSLGEPAYDRLAYERFARGLAAEPLAYVAACVRRAAYLLVGHPTQPEHFPLLFNWTWRGLVWDGLALNALIALGGVAGMVAARRFGWRQHWLPLLAASVALPFVATAVTDRYALPLRWLLMVYAGAWLWMVPRRHGRDNAPAAAARLTR